MRNAYLDGYKYCSKCMTWHRTRAKRCPICGSALRASSRRGGKNSNKPAVDPEKYLQDTITAT